MSIDINNIVKSFGSYKALDDINIKIEKSELVALLGPSGCGKTTLLRIIAGLEVPDSGSIIFDGLDAVKTDVRKRGVGFVFQHYALFRHMNIFQNVAFGLSVKKGRDRVSKEFIADKVNYLLKMVQMEWASDRYPHQLSGGQRQRVALARALAVEPKVLLLDEPFSALDAKVRQELRRWLRKLHDEMGITSVFVTHDQEEALELADRVVIINKGKIEQAGTPEEVYDNPVNPFVYNFLGNVNVFHCRSGERVNEKSVNETDESDTSGFVRPHDVEIYKDKINDDLIEAKISDVRMLKSIIGLELISLNNDTIIEAEISREKYKREEFRKGDKVFLELKKVRYFSKNDYVI